MAMYVRLKRRNQTIFLHVDPSNTFLQIKQSVAETLNTDAGHIMLYASDKVGFYDMDIYYSNKNNNNNSNLLLLITFP